MIHCGTNASAISPLEFPALCLIGSCRRALRVKALRVKALRVKALRDKALHIELSKARQVGTRFRRILASAPFGIDDATDDVIFY